MDADRILRTVTDIGLCVGLQGLGARIVFVVGRRLIDLALRITSSALARQEVDPTVQSLSPAHEADAVAALDH